MRSLKRVRGAVSWIVIVALLLIATMLPVAALAAIDVVQPTQQFYVLDNANVIDQKTENEIVDRSAALYKECGAQIVVVAVDFIGAYDIETYAMQLFNQWKIGGSSNNGVLLLMVIGADDYWCMQGKGLESKLSSGDIKSILDTYLEPDFAVMDYNTGVQKFYSAMYDKVASIYGAAGVDWASMEGWGGNAGYGTNNSSYSGYTGSDSISGGNNYDNGYNEGYKYEDSGSRSSGGFLSSLFGAIGGIIKTVAIIILVVILVVAFGIFGGRGGRGSSYRRPPRPPMFGPMVPPNDPRRRRRDDDHRGGFGGWGGFGGGGSSGGGFGGFGGGGHSGGGGGWGGGGGGSHSGGGGSTRGGGAGRG